ncbi:MAG: ABC transporter permease, partial [Shimia sp.]|nr:ABC transporter permease [Shimia sp.]
KRGREPITWTIDVLARIFGGVYYPLSILPASVRWITWTIPHTYALRGIRQVMINGARFGDADTALMFAALLAFCVASLATGVWMMNRALGRAERGNGVGIVV